MRDATKRRYSLSSGTDLSYVSAGEPTNPAVLLLHGFPQSARAFRDVIPRLSHAAHVIAPDLPGFGESEVLPLASFRAFAQAVSELLDHLKIGPRYIYLHDFGAPVGFEIAMQSPDDVRGLIIQNANAHRTGWGSGWAATQAFWADPTPANEVKATQHLTFEGTRDQYVANIPADVAARMSPESWEEDWRVMQLPGRLDTQKALIKDYGNYAAKFEEVETYLSRHQPAALMLWGRHDSFFELAEILSWMKTLPRMEAHVFDAGHLLLETHASEAASLMVDFIKRTKQDSGNVAKAFDADITLVE